MQAVLQSLASRIGIALVSSLVAGPVAADTAVKMKALQRQLTLQDCQDAIHNGVRFDQPDGSTIFLIDRKLFRVRVSADGLECSMSLLVKG